MFGTRRVRGAPDTSAPLEYIAAKGALMMETEEALDVVTLTDVVATIEDLNGRLWEPLSRIEGALDGSKPSIGEARAVEEGIELRLKTTADELGKLLGAYNRLADRF